MTPDSGCSCHQGNRNRALLLPMGEMIGVPSTKRAISMACATA